MSNQDHTNLRPTSIPGTDGAVSSRSAPPREPEAPAADEGSSWWIWLAVVVAAVAVSLDVGPLSKDSSHPRSSGSEYETWIRDLDFRYTPLSEYEKRQRAVEMMGP